MNATLGTAGIVLGVAASTLGIMTVAWGLRTKRAALLETGWSYSLLVLLGAVVSVIAMQRALITRDFTVSFVHDNGSSRTPRIFNVATMWSALEGSILLWVTILAGYTVHVARRFRQRLSDPMVGTALLVMFVVCLFFFLLVLGPANPFTRVDVPAGFDGPGPNPLLQEHILMAFHPPMLYLGMVGFTVPFAFAIAALATGRLGEGWLVETRRATLLAWGFLTIGIILGAWWSYEVLGWGGFWGWDPVENASLLPWLTGTAYLHSVMVQERRGMLRVWNLSLLCATFSLTILGTFLTRSGVLESVHAFSDSDIGGWLLSFFVLIVAVSLGLIGWRGDRLRSPGQIDSPVSREGAFLANNVLFAGFAFVVLLGTVFPLLAEALDDRPVTVGAPYFNRMTVPLGIALLFLMAVAPVLPWRKASEEVLARRLLWPAWAAAATMVVTVLLGARGMGTVLTFGLGAFAAGSAIRQLALATRRQGWRGLVGRANGGMIVHVGVVIIAVAIATNGHFAREVEAQYEPGETRVVSGHEITYLSTEVVQERNREATKVRVQVDGGQVYEPALSRYSGFGSLIGTPSVKTGLVEDVYLTVTRLPDEGSEAVTLRVIIQPMALWLWVGGGVMATGTVLAAWPGRRRRRPTDPVSAPLPLDDVADPVAGGRAMTDVQPTDESAADPIEAGGPRPALVVSIVIAVVVALLVAVLATRDSSTERTTQSPLLGEVAPPTEGDTIDGEHFSVADQRGRWVVLNFFASWCTPCIEEHPQLQAFDAAHRAEGDAVLVSTTFDDTAEKARRFFAEHGGSWPVIDDPDNSIGVAYGVAQVPETFVIAPNGVVVQRFAGPVSRAALDELIAAYEGPDPEPETES